MSFTSAMSHWQSCTHAIDMRFDRKAYFASYLGSVLALQVSPEVLTIRLAYSTVCSPAACFMTNLRLGFADGLYMCIVPGDFT